LLLTKKDLFDNIKSHSYLENMKMDAEKKMEHRELYFQKKLDLINQYKSHIKKETLKPSNLKKKPMNNLSMDFQSRSNIIQSYISEAEKPQESKNTLISDKRNHGFSKLLKSSIIAHQLNNIPKYKNKVISTHEKKNLEQNYESDLTNKIKILVQKRMEGALTNPTLIKKSIKMNVQRIRPKSSEALIQKRRTEDLFRKNEVNLKIKSFSKQEKKLSLGQSLHFNFKEDGTPKFIDKDFLFNFIIKKKI